MELYNLEVSSIVGIETLTDSDRQKFISIVTSYFKEAMKNGYQSRYYISSKNTSTRQS